MTKLVRIENADNSQFELVVDIYENEALTRTVELKYPCTLLEEYIHSSKYLVVRELKK